ncbi:MAG: hypothetical protein U5L05_18015 [Rubrivivax sp.]|nr:hypothetical protein [Rubrivivax sp.]
MGMPSFRRVLVSVSEAWKHKRADVLKGAESLRGIYAAAEGPTSAGHPLSAVTLGETIRATRNYYDQKAGGFGTAPKFPQAMVLDGLLRHWARTGEQEYLRLVRHAMTRMARGGIYDQLGGGFHRYSVDAGWLVPHFEKMLYDNALLARLAVHLWQATGDTEARRVAEETFGWVRREMTDPAGGWYSSLDADSEGHEGKFYVWSLAEVRALLADDAALAELHWGVTPGGNFEGANILHVAVPLDEAAARLGLSTDEARARIARAKEALFTARAPRVRPARDEKVLAGWNGLMLRALAEGARAFDDARAARGVREGRIVPARRAGEGRPGLPLMGQGPREDPRLPRGPRGTRTRIHRALPAHLRPRLARPRTRARGEHGRLVLERRGRRLLRHRDGRRTPRHAPARRDRQRDPVRDGARRGAAAARGRVHG